MQSVSSRIWTRVAVAISYDDNHYTTGTFFWDSCEWFCFQIRSDAKYFSSLVQGIVIEDL